MKVTTNLKEHRGVTERVDLVISVLVRSQKPNLIKSIKFALTEELRQRELPVFTLTEEGVEFRVVLYAHAEPQHYKAVVGDTVNDWYNVLTDALPELTSIRVTAAETRTERLTIDRYEED